MADLLEHLTQAKHNLDCAAKFIRDTQCRDWAITAAFYSAVHFAEIASYNVRYLPDWRTRLGTGLDYYSQTDAEKFLMVELPQVRQEIQKAAGVHLG